MHNPRTLPNRLAAMLIAFMVLAACSSPPATFSLAGATVDAAYWCPGGSSNAPYTVHARIQARNDTAREVTIDSATADMVLTGVTGSWLERVGDRYDAGTVQVEPTTVAPRSSATLTVAIPSACTSALYGSSGSSSGTYQ